MAGRNAFAVALAALLLGGCGSVGAIIGDRGPDVPLTKAEIQRCLALPHKVGERLVSPVPRPGNVFKPGYNFAVKETDGSYGFGHQEAEEGRVIIRYPAHHAVSRLDVVRRNGVVYFGNEPTNCP